MGWFKITFGASDNGNGCRTHVYTEKQTEQIIEQRTDQKTGEVKGIIKMEEVGNPSNRAESKPRGWLW